jgi:hypothetical protein
MNRYPQGLQSIVGGQLLKCDAFAELGHCGRNCYGTKEKTRFIDRQLRRGKDMFIA